MNALPSLPDVPGFPVKRPQIQADIVPMRKQRLSPEVDAGFVGRTYRSSLILTGFVLLYLWVHRQYAIIVPVGVGASVSLFMLASAEQLVRRVFVPKSPSAELTLDPSSAEGSKTGKSKWERSVRKALLGVSLLKYAIVATLIGFLVQHWETKAMLAFVAGISLVQIGIVLRVLSRCLVAYLNRKVSVTR